MGLGVAAVFGPHQRLLSSHVDSIASALEVPHLVTRRAVALRLPSTSVDLFLTQLFAVNLHPAAADLGTAYLDVLRHFNWSRFGVVYSDENGL